MKLIFVTGGARSGKSSFAEGLLKELGSDVVYLATAKALDEEMAARIKKHQSSRPKEWTTYEGYENLHLALPALMAGKAGLLLDCVTIMITNLIMDRQANWEQVAEAVREQIEGEVMEQFQLLVGALKELPGTAILVSNELGMGLVPAYPLSRFFRDVAGRVNQYLAREAQEVYFTVSGIPMKLK